MIETIIFQKRVGDGDMAGNVVMGNSSEGDVPAFVKACLEHTELIVQKLCGMKAVDRGRLVDYRQLAQAGSYCFCGDPYDGALYHLRAVPAVPLRFDDLGEEVQWLLEKQKLPFNVKECKEFSI